MALNYGHYLRRPPSDQGSEGKLLPSLAFRKERWLDLSNVILGHRPSRIPARLPHAILL